MYAAGCKRETQGPYVESANVDLAPAGAGRLAISLAVFALLGIAVWATMEPGKYRALTLVLLGFFAARSLMGFFQARARNRRVDAAGE
jgi:hypothetical protein